MKTTIKTTLATIAFITGFSLSPAFAAEPGAPVVSLSCDSGTSFESVVKILDALKAAGVKYMPTHITSTAESKDPRIVITAYPNTPYEKVIKIIEACKAAGVNTIALITKPADEASK